MQIHRFLPGSDRAPTHVPRWRLVFFENRDGRELIKYWRLCDFQLPADVTHALADESLSRERIRGALRVFARVMDCLPGQRRVRFFFALVRVVGITMEAVARLLTIAHFLRDICLEKNISICNGNRCQYLQILELYNMERSIQICCYYVDYKT